ncbi:MAG: 23S rRNA (uracil(1939)-C(5))-methyltransferase RlmD, partial [Clostridia bacterium]|nr:23S rRNA (uracil(1939)-C(5))-methyltransferase RlmD [Clostridia bacterium]
MCRLDCPHQKAFGGCAYGKQTYEETLREKENQVRRLLRPFCRVESIAGMEAPFHYRNKVHVSVGKGRDGSLVTGIYARDSHRIVPVQSCAIHDQKADETIAVIRSLAREFAIAPYDEDR